MRGDVLPDGICHDPDWMGGYDEAQELNFGEAPRGIRLERRQLEALVEYGD